MSNLKDGKFDSVSPKCKIAGKPLHNHPSPAQNIFESKYSCIFQEPMNRGKYPYVVIWVKYATGNVFCVSNIALRKTDFSPFLENKRFRVPIHFQANRFTFEKIPPPPPLLHPTT